MMKMNTPEFKIASVKVNDVKIGDVGVTCLKLSDVDDQSSRK